MPNARFKCGATVWAKATIITNGAELHRRFGRYDSITFLPGIVSKGFINESATGRKMKWVVATWYLGDEHTKVKEVALSSCKYAPPDISHLPTDLSLFRDHGGKMYQTFPPSEESVQKMVADGVIEGNNEDDSVTVDPTATPPVPRVFVSPPTNHNKEPNEPNVVVETVHNCEWTTDADMCLDTNGSRPTMPWCIKDSFHNRHSYGFTGINCLQLNYLLMMFPLKHCATQ